MKNTKRLKKIRHKLMNMFKGKSNIHLSVIVIVLILILAVAISMPDLYGKLSDKKVLGQVKLIEADYSDETVDSDLTAYEKINILDSDFSNVSTRCILVWDSYAKFSADNEGIITAISDSMNKVLDNKLVSMLPSEQSDMKSSFVQSAYVVVSKNTIPLENFYVWYLEFSTGAYSCRILMDATDYTIYQLDFETVYMSDILLTSSFTSGMDMNDKNVLWGNFARKEYMDRVKQYYGVSQIYSNRTYDGGISYIADFSDTETNTASIYFDFDIGYGGYAALRLMAGCNTAFILDSAAKNIIADNEDIYYEDESVNDAYINSTY